MELIKGPELQSLVDGVYGAVEGCGEEVQLVTTTIVPPANPNLESPKRVSTSITLDNPKPVMRNLSVQEVVDSKGTFQQGDRIFFVSASSATKDQIMTATEVLYGSQHLKIVQRKEGSILQGVVVVWSIVAGVRS